MLDPPLSDEEIVGNYTFAVKKGIAKVMAKMGISTLHSYKASIYVRKENKIDGDGDGSKSMSYKVRWLSCNLHCHYFSSLSLFKTGQFCWVFFFLDVLGDNGL